MELVKLDGRAFDPTDNWLVPTFSVFVVTTEEARELTLGPKE